MAKAKKPVYISYDIGDDNGLFTVQLPSEGVYLESPNVLYVEEGCCNEYNDTGVELISVLRLIYDTATGVFINKVGNSNVEWRRQAELDELKCLAPNTYIEPKEVSGIDWQAESILDLIQQYEFISTLDEEEAEHFHREFNRLAEKGLIYDEE